MIYIVLMLFIICVGGTAQPEELDKKYTKDKFLALRAILAMQIVFGHTFPNNAYGNLLMDKLLLPFNNTGFLCTSLFFFLSGYGVYESAKIRKDYFDHFFGKKVITILIPYWLINVLYIFAESMIYRNINFKNIIISLVWPVYNRAAWYVFAVLIMYLFFYITMRLLKLNGKRLYIAMMLLLSIYVILFFMLKVGSHWYVSTFAVMFGMIFSDYKKDINKYVKLIPTVFVFLFMYMGILWGSDFIPGVGIIIIKMILSVIAPLIVVRIMEKRRIERKWLNDIGIASYEIYLVQGLFVQYLVFSNDAFYMKELISLVNVILAVAVGWLVQKPISNVLNVLKNSIIHN